MNLLMTHGYLLSGSGSNVYVQNLCRALVKAGHDVHLICQDDSPLTFDFVSEWRSTSSRGTELIGTQGTQPTDYPGRCVVYRPQIGDLLPVYVYDEYPGWRVKTYLDLTDEELDFYLDRNVEAVAAVLHESGAELVVTNHSVPGPLIASRALEGSSVPYLSIVHGSCLQYLSRKSAEYMEITGEGLIGAKWIISPSPHGAQTINEDFPALKERTIPLTGGVDTELFHPDATYAEITPTLDGGAGRGEEQSRSLQDALSSVRDSEKLLASMEDIARSYEPRVHDRDAGTKLERFLAEDGPLVVYVGKLIHSKGVHSLISAVARSRPKTGARLLVVGFGTFREGLEAITIALANAKSPDDETLNALLGPGKRLEGGPDEPLEHFRVTDEVMSGSAGLTSAVAFIGPLDHASLSKILPAADVAVVPSIFPEIFGLVAAEFAASGVVPFVTDHSGLAEAGEIVGENLSFDLRVGMDGFEDNIAEAITDYLSLPEEERKRCSEIVRKNSVEKLGWDSLADALVKLSNSDV